MWNDTWFPYIRELEIIVSVIGNDFFYLSAGDIDLNGRREILGFGKERIYGPSLSIVSLHKEKNTFSH